MDDRLRQQFCDVLDLSRNMLDRAEAGAWETVATLEKQRREQIERCFSRPALRQDAREVANIIREVLALNQSIDVLAASARACLGDQISTHTTGKTASSAYRECAESA